MRQAIDLFGSPNQAPSQTNLELAKTRGNSPEHSKPKSNWMLVVSTIVAFASRATTASGQRGAPGINHFRRSE